MTDPIAQFKLGQKQIWAHFAILEAQTTPTAAKLINHANVRKGQEVLDVACGTGVAAITAARRGAHVTALDLTPELLTRARENAQLAGVEVDWHEGDVEQLPFGDARFDVVLSQFGHMFAPRPDVALSEMLRVLKPGGTIAFSTWPPDLLVGKRFAAVSRYMPPPPAGVQPPILWGDPAVIKQRFGEAVTDIVFDTGRMLVPALSVAHHCATAERSAGPILKLVQTLSASDPAKLAAFRAETAALVSPYFHDNVIHQDYLMTRATKI